MTAGKETWAELLEAGKQELKEAGIAEADLDAWYLFEAVFGISRAQYFLCAGERAGGIAERLSFDRKLACYEAALNRRKTREPLQHILGVQEFMGLEFYVNRHVLIPRQDTETLVELVLKEQKDKKLRILDMCTGSGCIAVSLSWYGGYQHVEAADISEEALSVAERNAEKILRGRISFRRSDLFSAFSDEEKFDVIVSNPPYIPSGEIEELEPEVRDFEPRLALDGTADGLEFYKRLAGESGKHLKEGGSVYFEIGHDQGEAVSKLLRGCGFSMVQVRKDLTGKDRVVCGRWQAGPDEEVSYV